MTSGRTGLLAIGLCLFACNCGDHDPGPSHAMLSLGLPAAVDGLVTTCSTCPEPQMTVVIEFPVRISDPDGPGATLSQLTTRVVNRSRGVGVAENVRPNSSSPLVPSNVPAAGQIAVSAGVVFGPPPPPRDEMLVSVDVRTTDGREASASAPLRVVFE